MRINKNNICSLYLILMRDVLARDISVCIEDSFAYRYHYRLLYDDYPHLYKSLQGYIDSIKAGDK